MGLACLWSSTEISLWSESRQPCLALREWDVAYGLKARQGREDLTEEALKADLQGGLPSRVKINTQFCLQDNSEGQEGVALFCSLNCSRFGKFWWKAIQVTLDACFIHIVLTRMFLVKPRHSDCHTSQYWLTMAASLLWHYLAILGHLNPVALKML